MSRVWAVNQAALPTQTMGWPSWNLPPAILLPVPSVPFSGTASTILLLSPAICWLSLDHKVTVPLSYCSRGWVSQSGPSWHSFPELLILKRLHIAGLGRILFSSASCTKSNIFCSSGLFCPFSWGKTSPLPTQSIHPRSFPVLTNTFHIPILILTLFLFIPGRVCFWVFSSNPCTHICSADIFSL